MESASNLRYSLNALTPAFCSGRALLCALGCLSLIGLSAPAQAQQPTPEVETLRAPEIGPELSRYISPNLNASEWAMMHSVMNSLPMAMRQHIASMPAEAVSVAVVEGGTGIIHYNKPEEAGSYEVHHQAPALPGDEHPFAAAAQNVERGDVAAETTKDPGVFGGSGPYRRIYTVPVPAAPLYYLEYGDAYLAQDFYQQAGAVSIDCVAGNMATGDLGYSYLGGWSGNWAAYHDGSAVDAGLQYNRGASTKSFDDYSMFLKIAGEDIMSRGNGKAGVDGSAGYPVPPHIVCSNIAPVALTFGVLGAGQLRSVAPQCWQGEGSSTEFIGFPIAECNTYALYLEAETVQFSGSVGHERAKFIVWVAPDIATGGWAKLVPYKAEAWHGKANVEGFVVDATCKDCMFKWMTSIAQKKENLKDKSNYSARWTSRLISFYAFDKHSNALTDMTTKLTQCSEYPLWTPPYSSDHAKDCKDSPLPGKGKLPPPIVVTDYSPTGERDAINLQ